MLASLLTRVALIPVTMAPDPFGAGTLRMTVARFGLVEDHDVLIAGSQRACFPTEQDRLLLGLAANQAAIVLQRHRPSRPSSKAKNGSAALPMPLRPCSG